MFIEPQDNISISKVPAETKSADDEVEGPMSIEPPVCEAVLPLNVAIRTRQGDPAMDGLVSQKMRKRNNLLVKNMRCMF